MLNPLIITIFIEFALDFMKFLYAYVFYNFHEFLKIFNLIAQCNFYDNFFNFYQLPKTRVHKTRQPASKLNRSYLNLPYF